jgi:hypothetical protein
MILILNVTGIHNYHEANVNENDENLLLKGNITVISEANDVLLPYTLAIIMLILLVLSTMLIQRE